MLSVEHHHPYTTAVVLSVLYCSHLVRKCLWWEQTNRTGEMWIQQFHELLPGNMRFFLSVGFVVYSLKTVTFCLQLLSVVWLDKRGIVINYSVSCQRYAQFSAIKCVHSAA